MNLKKFFNKKWIFSILLISIVFTSVTPAITTLGNYSAVKMNPKLSQTQIEIISPVNQTYTPHMEGYYPATFGFEDVEDRVSDRGQTN